MQRYSDAEEQYLVRCQMYAINFPLTFDHAIHLEQFAKWYLEIERADAALEFFLKACQVFETLSIADLAFAGCLEELGKLYLLKGLKSEAVQRLEQSTKMFKDCYSSQKIQESKDKSCTFF